MVDDEKVQKTRRRSRRTLAAVAVAVAAVAGGGAAVAATALSTPQQENDAILADAAGRLGVEPQKLSDALRQAYEARIDERVKAGELSEEQGQELKDGLESGDVPLVGTPGRGDRGERHGFGIRHGAVSLEAAATYLGLDEAALRQKLEDGDTLADVAKAQGKTVEGLEQALTAAATEELDARVAAGDLTKEQETQLLEDLSTHLDAMINGELRGPGGFGRGGHHGGELRVGLQMGLDAAATYLGLEESALRERLRGGESLADVAKAQGKTVDGLKQALTAAATTQLDEQVKAGRLTEAQKTELLQRLSEHLDDLIAGTLPKMPFGHGGDEVPAAPSAPSTTTPDTDPASAAPTI